MPWLALRAVGHVRHGARRLHGAVAGIEAGARDGHTCFTGVDGADRACAAYNGNLPQLLVCRRQRFRPARAKVCILARARGELRIHRCGSRCSR